MASVSASRGDSASTVAYSLLSADLVHLLSSFLAIRSRCLALLPTCRYINSHLLTSPAHSSDAVLAVSSALLRTLSQATTSAQYAQYVSSLPLSLVVGMADMWPNSIPPADWLTPEQFIAACGLPSTHSRPQTLQQYEAEADPEAEEDFDAPAEEQYARQRTTKDRLDYGPPLVLSSLSPSLQTALRGLTHLRLRHVSLPLADLSSLLSCTPRLRAFCSEEVQHVSAAALLLLARYCPMVQRINLVNSRSPVLGMRKAQLDAAEQQLQLLSPPPPPLPSEPFTSLQTLEVKLADFEADVDEAGFAQLVSLLASAPLQWFRFCTMAALPAASFALLARFDALKGLDMTCCCRPAVYALLYGAEYAGMGEGAPNAVSLYTEALVFGLQNSKAANCSRRFVSTAARAAFFEAVAALPSTPDDRAAYVAAREEDIDEWPKADIDFLVVELPRERRRRFYYEGAGEGFDSEDD